MKRWFVLCVLLVVLGALAQPTPGYACAECKSGFIDGAFVEFCGIGQPPGGYNECYIDARCFELPDGSEICITRCVVDDPCRWA